MNDDMYDDILIRSTAACWESTEAQIRGNALHAAYDSLQQPLRQMSAEIRDLLEGQLRTVW